MKKSLNRLAIAGVVSAAVGLVGIPAAQADEIMFPYTAGSSTVTTILTVMVKQPGVVASVVGGIPIAALHYAHWFKNGDPSSNLTACVEVDRNHPSSEFDIVTFDVYGEFGTAPVDTGGVLFADAGTGLDDYTALGATGADFRDLMGALTINAPFTSTRGFSIIDNNLTIPVGGAQGAQPTGFPGDSTLAGEAMIYEVNGGAAWSYAAYNPSGVAPPPGGGPYLPNFADAVEINGEVLNCSVAACLDGQGTPEQHPIAILPKNGTNLDDWETALLVTAISHTGQVPVGPSIAVPNNQQNGMLNVSIGLRASTTAFVGYDRDEQPVSGRIIVDVLCVDRVEARDMIGGLAQTSFTDGGWAWVVITPGTYTAFTPIVGSNGANSLANVDEAIVYKLNHNLNGWFNNENVPGTVNNVIWLRNDGSVLGSDNF